MDEVETTTQGSKTLANVALAVGLLSAIGPFLFALEWYSILPGLGAVGMLAGPVGVVLGAMAIVLCWRKPSRIHGRGRAIGGLLASLFGVGCFCVLNAAYHAQYGPWGPVIQADIESQFETLAKSLGKFCEQNDGRFPESPDALLEHDSEAKWCLHAFSTEEKGFAPVTNLHYVTGLDKSCPPDWIVVFAASDLFNNEGGALITVDGSAKLLDEPEFGQALMQFKAAYERERGVPPEIVAPH